MTERHEKAHLRLVYHGLEYEFMQSQAAAEADDIMELYNSGKPADCATCDLRDENGHCGCPSAEAEEFCRSTEGYNFRRLWTDHDWETYLQRRQRYYERKEAKAKQHRKRE